MCVCIRVHNRKDFQIDPCEDTEEHWDRLSPCPFCGHEDSPVLARNQRSCSDPTVSGLSRLPPIVSFGFVTMFN